MPKKGKKIRTGQVWQREKFGKHCIVTWIGYGYTTPANMHLFMVETRTTKRVKTTLLSRKNGTL